MKRSATHSMYIIDKFSPADQSASVHLISIQFPPLHSARYHIGYEKCFADITLLTKRTHCIHYIHKLCVKIGIILAMGSANERRRYNVTSSFICWAHTQNETMIILAFMVYSVSGLSQWETTPHCNIFSQCLNPQPEWRLLKSTMTRQDLAPCDAR